MMKVVILKIGQHNDKIKIGLWKPNAVNFEIYPVDIVE